MSILYTSGTTGNPKGVLLSHGNMLHQLGIAYEGILSKAGEKTLQVLPIWHAYERIAQYYFVSVGCHMHYTTLSGLKNDLIKYEVGCFMSVPRIWEALKNGVYQKLKQTSPILYKVFTLANEEITTKTPTKGLLAKVKKSGGRNNQGKMTVRHIGGGAKRKYRIRHI